MVVIVIVTVTSVSHLVVRCMICAIMKRTHAPVSAEQAKFPDSHAPPVKRPYTSPQSASTTDSPSLWRKLSDVGASQETLWSMLSDRDVVHGMCVNKATLAQYGEYPVQRGFSSRALAQPTDTHVRGGYYSVPIIPLSNKYCQPRITRITDVSLERLPFVLEHAPHVTDLMFTKVSGDLDGRALPATITSLTLRDFDGKLTGPLPASLTECNIYGTQDMMELDNQPEKKGLYSIEPNILPICLKRLKLEQYPLKKPLAPGVLPNALAEFEYSCNQPIVRGALNEGLQCLELMWAYNWQVQPGLLPRSLERLRLGYSFNRRLLPGALPVNLKQLITGDMFMEPFDKGVIPASLEVLIMKSKHWNYPFHRDVFPPDSKLRVLKFLIECRHFNQPFTVQSLPPALEVLDLTGCRSFDQPFRKGVLPAELLSLTLPPQWSHPLTANMFASCPRLENLSLYECSEWDLPIKPQVLPPRLRALHLPYGGNYSHKLKVSLLPPTMELLELSDREILQGTPPAKCRVVCYNEGEEDDEDEEDEDEEDEDEEEDDGED